VTFYSFGGDLLTVRDIFIFTFLIFLENNFKPFFLEIKIIKMEGYD